MAKEKSKNKEPDGDFTVALNRRGRYNYEIEESLEVGLALTGTEVKSARASQAQIAEAYARLEDAPSARKGGGKGRNKSPEVWIHGMFIAPYEQGGVYNVEPRRKRKLLLHRAQIDKLVGRVSQKGYSLIPLKLYFTRGRAKLELGIGKGRKTHDKRRAITERETKRDLSRHLSRQ
jgi:SsrA-binding protein